MDHDHDLITLATLRDRIARDGPHYPHLFALRPNSGWPTGLDMDGDGRRGGPGDAQGYGAFSGQGGMALLSRFPIATEAARDWSALLWRDLPGALLPEARKAAKQLVAEFGLQVQVYSVAGTSCGPSSSSESGCTSAELSLVKISSIQGSTSVSSNCHCSWFCPSTW